MSKKKITDFGAQTKKGIDPINLKEIDENSLDYESSEIDSFEEENKRSPMINVKKEPVSPSQFKPKMHKTNLTTPL